MPAVAVDPARILPSYGGYLVAITAQVTLNPNDSLDLPADALRNVLGERLNLDSFRWTIDAQQAVSGTADPPTVPVGYPGHGIATSVKFGGRAITAGEVPIYCLGPSIGQDVEHCILGVAEGPGSTETLLGAYASGIWDFDYPLTVDQGEALTVHFTHKGLQNLPVVVSLALTGRIGRDLPNSRWLPFAAAWTPPAFIPTVPTATAPVVVTSTERDLINSTGMPLHVSRLIGRLMRLSVQSSPVSGTLVQNAEMVFSTVPGSLSGQPPSTWFPSQVDSFMTVTLRDSRANDNIPTAIQFRTIFEPETRAFEAPHILDPSAYYLAQLSLAVPAVTSDSAIQPAIAMLGSYEGG